MFDRVLITLQKQPFTDVLQNTCSYKFCNIHRKRLVLESFLYIKVRAWKPATLLKRDFNAGVFSCKIWQIFMNSFFYKIILVAASKGFCIRNGSTDWFKKSYPLLPVIHWANAKVDILNNCHYFEYFWKIYFTNFPGTFLTGYS